MKTYRQTITLVILLTIFVSLGTAFGTATPGAQRNLSEFIPTSLKSQLSPDATNIERLSTEGLAKVILFNNKVENLKRRGNVTPQEATVIQAEGNALKSLLGNLRNSLNSLVNQLKSA